MAQEHRIPGKPVCPHCEHLLDYANHHDNNVPRGPETGDLTICVYCGGLSSYLKNEDGKMTLQKLSQDSLDHIKNTDEDLWREIQVLQEAFPNQNKTT